VTVSKLEISVLEENYPIICEAKTKSYENSSFRDRLNV
jgi:hypothetical protein